ncbi:MAG: response regulator, partial [Desulfotignum sp.]|nr:response regulator [Desulfotignum sp.]
RKGLRQQGEEKGVVEAIYKVRLPGGSIVWLKDQATVTAFKKDNIYISSGSLTIVTKEMEAEEELIKAQKMLKEKARALNLARKIQEENSARLSYAIEQIEAARKDAEKANRAKSEFLAVISHEIRNPMNGIVGTCDLIMADDLSRQQKEYLEIVKNSAFSLLGLINDILDFSKIEAGKLEFQEVQFDVRDVVDEVSDIFLELISKKNLELIVDIDPDVPVQLISDPMRLRQVLINLTSNALKFTHQGEIIIRVEQSRRDRSHAELIFRVTDTGIGIAPQYFDNLFDSFTQVNDGLNREYGGTGLGLAICRQIIEMMNGAIWVESVKGEGSSFYFKVPFKYIQPKKTEDPRIPAVFNQYRALVVQENKSSLQMFRQLLCSWGFTVEAMSSGRQVLDMFFQNSISKEFDLVIMDMGLGDLADEKVTGKIKSMVTSSGLFIALSRMGRNDEVNQAKEIGVDRSLTKPVKQSLLLEILKNHFEHDVDTDKTEKKQAHSGKPFSNTPVLLVEDNAINLKIGSEMLRMAGVDVDTAQNGIEAIEKVQKKDYAAVLIDIQMPHLDGIEASRIIRQQFSKTSLPIIAMSAHAKSDNWKACLEAGINDYILKPISRNVLFTALKNQIGASHGILSPGPAANQDESRKAFFENMESLPGLNIKEGIERLGGAADIYADILNDFCKEYTTFHKRVKHLIADSDFKGAATLSHSLKGAAGNISAVRLFDSAKSLEQACWNKNYDEINRLLDPVQSDYQEVCRSAGQFLGQMKPGKIKKKAIRAEAGTKDGADTLTFLMESLMNSLEQCDPVQSESVIEKMEPMVDAAWSKQISSLAANIKNYQFDAAKANLKTLMKNIQKNR